MASGQRRLGQNVTIHPTAEINVDFLEIGSGSIIGPHVLIEGTKVVLGREAWLDRYSYIGGGSAHDPGAFLTAGDFFHMGRQSHINIARGVQIGDEFGCGVETKVFTHGAYPSELDGFPVSFAGITIGDRVWLPNAWVNPGVTIGSDVVVGARSLVNRDLPNGCLAAGIPCKVLKERCYPSPPALADRQAIVRCIMDEAQSIATARGWQTDFQIADDAVTVTVSGAVFDLQQRSVAGTVSQWSEVVKNQLRRHGIRFKFGAFEGQYRDWASYGY